jgi:hypothetical protein
MQSLNKPNIKRGMKNLSIRGNTIKRKRNPKRKRPDGALPKVLTKEIKNLMRPTSYEHALLNPGLTTWVDIPSCPHSYGIFSNHFLLNLTCNASGALGVAVVPSYVPSVQGSPFETNIVYWNGINYTGTSYVSTSGSNTCIAASNTDNLWYMDSATMANIDEVACLGYKLTVYSPNAYTTIQGSVAGCIRPFNFASLNGTVWTGTTETAATNMDKYNYSGAITGGNGGTFAEGTLVGGNQLVLKYKPHETNRISDFMKFIYNTSNQTPATMYPDVIDNVMFLAIWGAAASQTISLKVESIYAYTGQQKSIALQNVRFTNDSRVPSTVLYDINKANFTYASINKGMDIGIGNSLSTY